MKKRTTISRIDRVSLPGESKDSGKSLDPSKSRSPQLGGESPGKTQLGLDEPTKKKGPGRRTLAPEDKLPDDFVERIRQQIEDAVSGKGAEWNIGGIPDRPGEGSAAGEMAQADGPSIGNPVESPPGGDTRIWVDPETLDKEIDEANRRGEENERVSDSEKGREEKTDGVKSAGKGGSGRGRVRDRIAVEKLSQTDWASIFRTRLTEYSRENSQYLPWNRRFVAQPTMLGRKIGSKTPTRDVLPEVNLLVDTSSSLSYREMAVILGEIEKALESAKVKLINVFLWHQAPYAYKEFKDISSKNFNKIIDWIQSNWEGGWNDEIALYNYIIKKGKAKKFTIMLTDAQLADHMRDGTLKQTWTKALDPANLIFAIIYPNKSITYESWLKIGNRMPGLKIPIFLDSSKFNK
jgi:hypothetical protein